MRCIELNDSGSGGLRERAPLVNAPSAWAAGYTGAGQTIAILDSGIDKNHPFMSGKVAAEACFSQPDPAFPLSSSTLCPNGQVTMTGVGAGVNCNVTINGCSHGTHVAGIAAGSSTAEGIWGIARGANLISIQVFHRVDDQNGCPQDPAPCARYFFNDLLQALNYVANNFSVAAVVATVTFPPKTSISSFGPPGSFACSSSIVNGNPTLTCAQTTLNTGDSFAIAILLVLATDYPWQDGLAATASVASATADPDSSNNSVTVNLAVQPPLTLTAVDERFLAVLIAALAVAAIATLSRGR